MSVKYEVLHYNSAFMSHYCRKIGSNERHFIDLHVNGDIEWEGEESLDGKIVEIDELRPDSYYGVGVKVIE